VPSESESKQLIKTSQYYNQGLNLAGAFAHRL